MSRSRHALSATTLSCLAIFQQSLWLSRQAVASEQGVSASGNSPTAATPGSLGGQKDQATELLQLRLEKMIVDQALSLRRDVEASLGGELKEHRDYLEKLDEKFYARFSLWIGCLSVLGSIVATAGAVVVGMIIWNFNKSRKEALENFKSEAKANIDTIAREKVTELASANNIRAVLQGEVDKLSVEVQMATGALIKKAEQQLGEARDKFIQENFTAVIKAVEGSLSQKFSTELDVVKRVEGLQSKLAELESQIAGLKSMIWGPPRSRNQGWAGSIGQSGIVGGQGSPAVTGLQGFPGAGGSQTPAGATGLHGYAGGAAPQGYQEATGFEGNQGL